MNLDIRFPIGGFFSIVGFLLVVFGFVSDPTLYQKHSFGINVNLWWGLVLLVFGVLMLSLAWGPSYAKYIGQSWISLLIMLTWAAFLGLTLFFLILAIKASDTHPSWFIQLLHRVRIH